MWPFEKKQKTSSQGEGRQPGSELVNAWDLSSRIPRRELPGRATGANEDNLLTTSYVLIKSSGDNSGWLGTATSRDANLGMFRFIAKTCADCLLEGGLSKGGGIGWVNFPLFTLETSELIA